MGFAPLVDQFHFSSRNQFVGEVSQAPKMRILINKVVHLYRSTRATPFRNAGPKIWKPLRWGYSALASGSRALQTNRNPQKGPSPHCRKILLEWFKGRCLQGVSNGLAATCVQAKKSSRGVNNGLAAKQRGKIRR